MDQKLDSGLISFAYNSPIGKMQVVLDKDKIISLDFNKKTLDNHIQNIDNQYVDKFTQQMNQYFNRERKLFDLKMSPQGSSFQKDVWKALLNIPYGKTFSYGELAKKLGGKEKTRAVASAIAKNPILILIPCHRVIGSNGKLTGFSGGIERKARLLELEGNSLVFDAL